MKTLIQRSTSDMITIYATLVLGSVLLVVVFSLFVDLFVSNKDDEAIFNLISPAFQTIVGAFVGLISGIHLGQKQNETNKVESLPPTPPTNPTLPTT